MTDQFDLFKARAQRDLGMKRVAHKCDAWITLALTRIRTLPHGYEGIAEEIRIELRLDKPPSSGAVGAMTRMAGRLGLLAKTGSMRQPRGVKSHARATYVWRKL